jgi:hypothetical protein
MHQRHAGLACVGLAMLALAATAGAQTAVLRQDDQKYVVDVAIAGTLEGAASLVTMTLFSGEQGQENTITTGSVTPVPIDNGKRLLLRLPLTARPPSSEGLKVRIAAGGVHWVDGLAVGVELKPEFTTEPGRQCDGGIALILSGDPAATTTPDYWQTIFTYIFAGGKELTSPQDKVSKYWAHDTPEEVLSGRISIEGTEKPLRLRSITTPTTLTGAALVNRLILCLDPAYDLPAGAFNIELRFSRPNPPLPLSGVRKGEKVSGTGTPMVENAAAKPGTVGSRPRERNLDLGMSLTSSHPADAEKRTNRGLLDLRFAPWLNWRRPPVPPFTQRWFPYWTPIYLDANIATGDITKETLSLNRVQVATEVEYRYIPFEYRLSPSGALETATGHFTTVHRFVFGAKHGSDRDFNQLEFTTYGEWKPLYAALNRPRQANWRLAKDPISGKSAFQYSNVGWEVKPRVGYDVGRTYKRRNPAAAVAPSATARRLYGGVEIRLNLTQHITTAIVETLYWRGELEDSRGKNHFKWELDLPLSRPFAGTVHGMFANYERGNQPPFATADVNAFTIGYRIRSAGWWGITR